MYRINIIILLTAILVPALTINPLSAQDREAVKIKALKTGYNMLLSEVDKDKNGKISMEECLATWKDKAIGESKCKYWDKNGNGIITEEEYVQQGLQIMK
jgi:Ca2+-binding EF-hand superfamily protein